MGSKTAQLRLVKLKGRGAKSSQLGELTMPTMSRAENMARRSDLSNA